QANDNSNSPSISASGGRVAFVSNATNLDPVDDLNGQHNPNVLVRDMGAATTKLVSRHNFSVGLTHTMEASQFSKIAMSRHALSADGRYVAFRASRNGGPFEIAPCTDTYEHRTIVAADVDAGGFVKELAFSNKGCNGLPAISADASTIVFRNVAATGWYNVGPGGGTLAETLPSGLVGGDSVSHAVVSGDGSKFVFSSGATGLVGGDTNSHSDVFSVTRGGSSARRLSLDSDGRQAASYPNNGAGSDDPSVSDAGYQVAFSSGASDLVSGDTNGATDVFVRGEVPEYLTLAQVLALLGPRRLNAFLASDPVDTATGNFTDTWSDLAFPATVFGLDWHRTLNSRDPVPGVLGRGWSTAFGEGVSALSGGDVQLVEDSGRTVVFRSNGSGGWASPEELWATLVADADGSYSLRYHSGEVADFDAAGRLASRSNWDGQNVTIARDPQGRVATATSSAGPSLTFTYDPSAGRLTKVASSDGRRVRYAFRPDAMAALATVTLPDDRTLSYGADATGRTNEARDGQGRLIVSNVYDSLGRTLSQATPEGGAVSFAYDQAARATTVTDGASGDVTRYVHDTAGRPVGVVDATGASLARGYDAAGTGLLISATDRSGAALEQEYTPQGLLAAQALAGVNADGSGRRSEFAYDGEHRVREVRDKVPGGTDLVTTLTYLGAARVPATVSGPAPAGDPAPPVTAIESDAGLVTRVTDPDGVVVAAAWDTATRRRLSVTVAPGTADVSTTTFGYTPEGWLATVTSALGHTTAYEYDSAGRQTLRRDPDGAEWRTGYDGAGRVSAAVDPLGHRVTSHYDPTTGRLVERLDERGKSTRFRYSPAGDLSEVVGPDDDADPANDPTTRYAYVALGRLDSVTDPAGVVTRYSYDANGRVTAVADANGDAARTTYWPDGQVKTQAHAETATGQETRSFYDRLGRLDRVVGPTGAETRFGYDAAGRLVRTEGPVPAAVEVRTYTPAGRLATVTAPTGSVTRHGYDAAGRPSTVTAGDGTASAATTTRSFDAGGRVVRTTSPSALATTFSYDAAGRLLTETAPGARVTRATWTARGELASVTDPEGATVSYTYDLAGNLATVRDALGNATSYEHDARNNRVSRTDALGGVEQWSFDAADRPTTHRDRTGSLLTTWAYDPLGRLASITDASGRVEARTYDRAGRLVRQRFTNGAEALDRTFTYDPAGRRRTATGTEGTTTWTYDPAGNVTSVDAPGTDADLAYGWDLAGRRTSVTHPDGTAVTSTYDALGRPATVSHPAVGTTSYTWRADGRLLSEDLPGAGNDRAWSYDPVAGDPVRYVEHLGGATTVDTTLGHDRNGRLTSAATAGSSAQAYRYDAAGQLTTVLSGGATAASYAYDVLGRRTRSTDASGTFDYAYDPAGRLTSRTTPDPDYPLSVKAQVNGQTVGTLAGHRPGDATYAYDGAGRRTARTGPEGATSYAYGPDGRLVTTTAGAVTTGRTYDGAGNLASVTVDDGSPDTTRLAWDDSAVPQLLQLTDARGRVELIRGEGLLGVTTNTGPALTSADHLGSVLPTTATGGLVAGGYGPFGEPAATRPEPVLGYRGELQVGSLLHLRAREYDPVAGIFTSPDPLDGVDGTPVVANPYHYGDNDPLNRTDPTGLRSKDKDLECVKAAVALVPAGGFPAGAVLVGGTGLRLAPTPSPSITVQPGGGTVNCLDPGTKKKRPGLMAAIAAAIALLGSGSTVWTSRLPERSDQGEGGGGPGSSQCQAPQTTPTTVGDDCDEDVVPLFKAPQPGFGADQYANGWNRNNLTADDDPSFGEFATFAKERELADLFASSYGEGVIEVLIPRDIYDANFARYEYPYEGGPLTELEIPFGQLPLLNQFPRAWHQ
ncbi:MAG: DUF6531 domain-containing protein, partial [Acidimicrobiales bacterium]